MRLICPQCQQAITVADTEAGKTIACPQCAANFPAPQMYVAPPIEPLPGLPPAPPVAPAPPPQPIVAPKPTISAPPHSSSGPKSAVNVSSASAADGYAHHHGVALNQKICHWIVPIALSLVFLLSFFKWFGFYPAGYAAYTQNAWQALFATMSVDPVCEKVFDKEKELNNALSPSWWLLPFVLLMLLGLLLSWAEPVVKAFNLLLPAMIVRWWGHRPALISACAGLMLFFLLLQCAAGFGLERARSVTIDEAAKERREKGKTPTPEEIQIAEMQVAKDTGGLSAKTTIWLYLTILFQLLAVAGVAAETVLIHRGHKPPPRVDVKW